MHRFGNAALVSRDQGAPLICHKEQAARGAHEYTRRPGARVPGREERNWKPYVGYAWCGSPRRAFVVLLRCTERLKLSTWSRHCFRRGFFGRGLT
eukprot:3201600-Pyramimonas_sp.AAC.1